MHGVQADETGTYGPRHGDYVRRGYPKRETEPLPQSSENATPSDEGADAPIADRSASQPEA